MDCCIPAPDPGGEAVKARYSSLTALADRGVSQA